MAFGTRQPQRDRAGSNRPPSGGAQTDSPVPKSSNRRRPNWFSSAPQSVLLKEAERLREQRDWRSARRVLEAANATAVDASHRRTVLELTATAAAEASKHTISSNAVYELAQLEPRPASTWVAIGDVALARGNYQHADTAARQALEKDPSNQAAHVLLSVSFAGLGWFDQATTCLDSVDRMAITQRQRHQLGQAVNRWATTKTMAFPLALLAALVAGVLAISVGLSVPILTRRLRLHQLAKSGTVDNIFAETAMTQWADQKMSRALTSVAMVLPVLFYVGLALTQ